MIWLFSCLHKQATLSLPRRGFSTQLKVNSVSSWSIAKSHIQSWNQSSVESLMVNKVINGSLSTFLTARNNSLDVFLVFSPGKLSGFWMVGLNLVELTHLLHTDNEIRTHSWKLPLLHIHDPCKVSFLGSFSSPHKVSLKSIKQFMPNPVKYQTNRPTDGGEGFYLFKQANYSKLYLCWSPLISSQNGYWNHLGSDAGVLMMIDEQKVKK